MNLRLLLLVLALGLAQAAAAIELTLFDLQLSSATPAALHRAAIAAGAQPQKGSGGHRIYDARKMGLPGAIQLEMLFDGERFVIATYTFERRHSTEHELRRLLVAKYGRPYLLADRRRHEIELEAPYAEAPGVRWEVDPPMELVYTNIRGGTEKARLSYVNRALFEELERRVSEEGRKNDRARAEQLGKTF